MAEASGDPGWRRRPTRGHSELLEEPPPCHPLPVAVESYEQCWRTPYGLDLDGLPERPDRNDLPLLAVSHGLSLERQFWPIYFMPDEIETLNPPVSSWSPFTPTYPDDK